MVTEPIPLDIPPGVVITLSSNAAKGRFIACDHIRFNEGKVEKMGGWVKLSETTVDGVIRGSLGWTSIAGQDLLAAGTWRRLYSIADEPVPITPLRDSGTLGNDPFTAVDTETIVTVSHTSHGLEAGAIVHFDGADPVGGITIDGEYEVITVTDANTYTIEHASPATSSASGGGNTVDYEYEINPGLVSASQGLGFGAGPYGEEEYGTPRTSGGVALDLRYWHFGTRLGRLYALPSGGTVYTWNQPNNDERAAVLTNAPVVANAMFITPENIVVVLGCTNLNGDVFPMTMRWNDRDNPTVWAPAETNTANERTLNAGNRLIAGARLGTVSLIWSDYAVFLMQFTNATGSVYSTDVIGEQCGLIGPGAFVIAPGMAAWMTPNNFYFYNGSVAPCPRVGEVREAIFHPDSPFRFDSNYATKTWCGFNHKHNEIWWGYVSVNSTDQEPDRYVKVNLADWSWDVGSLMRTSMANMKSPNGDILMGGVNSYIYVHETGLDADDQPLEAYIQTGIVALRNGAVEIEGEGFVPDFERQNGDLTLDFNVYRRPNSQTPLETVQRTIGENDELVDFFFGGRHVDMRITSNTMGGDFRFGIPAVEIGAVRSDRG